VVQRVAGGARDGFISAIDAFGRRFLFSTLLGGSADDYVSSVRLDSEEHVYGGGFTASNDFLSGVRPPRNLPEGFILQVGREGDRVRFLTYMPFIPRLSAVTIDIRLRRGNDLPRRGRRLPAGAEAWTSS
jgi:hypothetical protein